jgi:glycosyltransferase involved in cell wall biosynthesis
VSAYLWIIDLSYSNRLHHGGLLRYFNLSRELVAQGHTVTFAVFYEEEREKGMAWLDSLQAQGVFTRHCEIVIDRTLRAWNRRAMFLLPFRLHHLAIRPFIAAARGAITAILQRYPADAVIVSSRRFIFVAHDVPVKPCLGDFSDSETLRVWREFKYELRRGRYGAAVRRCPDLFAYFFLEFHTCRKYAVNILVSPVDKHLFDRIGIPEKNVCLTNGVRTGVDPSAIEKLPQQVIFSGAMNFPPNFEGAIWFLDYVFPLVKEALPGVNLLIAGAQPDPKLVARAGPDIQVSGFVADLNKTIAESDLYVAPLVTGCGFKNKVIEAIANGTYVIGTTFAAECLEPEIRNLITVRDEPREMAAAIIDYFSNPAPYLQKLSRLMEIVRDRFSWSAKAAELASLTEMNRTVQE